MVKMNRLNHWSAKVAPSIRQKVVKASSQTVSKFIIEYAGHNTDQLATACEANQGRIYREIGLIRSLAVELPHGCLEELIRFRAVRKIWLDFPVRVCLDVAVPSTGATQLHQLGFCGKGIVVAIIDTGIFPHPDLTQPTGRIQAWHDLVSGQLQPYDDNGHGTHVAGIVASSGQLSLGKYAGMAPQAELIGVKVMDRDGGGELSTVIAGIEWCLNHQSRYKIRIINLSLGAEAQESYLNDPLSRATYLAWKKGVVVCAAAGNEGPQSGTINTPGINPITITVGNSNDQATIPSDDDRLNDSSSRGPTIDNLVKPDLLAPGTQITSLWPDGGYRTLTGTSMATPMVSGAAALLLEAFPHYTPSQVKQRLLDNAKDLGLASNLQGAGLLNLENIVSEVMPAPQVKTAKISR